MISKRLSRQLKKAFGSEQLEELQLALRSAAETTQIGDHREMLERVAEGMTTFARSIDTVYEQLEEKATMAQRNLELSSQELNESNSSLFQLNQTSAAMLNCLGQGFLLFDKTGMCLPSYSKACEEILEIKPGGKDIGEVLKISPNRRVFFDKWRAMLFQGSHDIEDLLDIAPKTFPASDAHKTISVDFKPVTSNQGEVIYVVVVATDRSAEVSAREEATRMHAFATMVTNVLRDRRAFQSFVRICWELMAEMNALLDKADISEEDVTLVKRHFHTIKGGAAAFGLVQISSFIHDGESRLMMVNDLPDLHRICLAVLSQLKSILGSLLEENRELFDVAEENNDRTRDIPLKDLRWFHQGLMNRMIEDPAEEFRARFLAVPVKFSFRNFARILTSDASKLGKEIAPMKIVAEDGLRLIPEMYDRFLASLVHVFHNIADHGIEKPEARLAAKKPREGQVTLSVSRLNVDGADRLVIEIQDDGGGIDPAKIRAKLNSVEAKVLNDEQLIHKIFDQGFSTAEVVTEHSGRGVGMHAIQNEVIKLGGKISVSSQLGKGTKFTIQLPYFQDFNDTEVEAPSILHAS